MSRKTTLSKNVFVFLILVLFSSLCIFIGCEKSNPIPPGHARLIGRYSHEIYNDIYEKRSVYFGDQGREEMLLFSLKIKGKRDHSGCTF